MRHVPDLCPDILKLAVFKYRDRAASGAREPGDCTKKGGLPGPVIAKDDVELAGTEFRADSPQCGEAAELLDDVFGFDDRSWVHVDVETLLATSPACATMSLAISKKTQPSHVLHSVS